MKKNTKQSEIHRILMEIKMELNQLEYTMEESIPEVKAYSKLQHLNQFVERKLIGLKP